MIYIFDSLIAHVNSKYPSDKALHDHLKGCIDACKIEVYNLENRIDDLEDDIYRFERNVPDQSTEDRLTELETLASDIVQKHRCKEAWESYALNLLYKLANKVV